LKVNLLEVLAGAVGVAGAVGFVEVVGFALTDEVGFTTGFFVV
jgi:hypothetical protein